MPELIPASNPGPYVLRQYNHRSSPELNEQSHLHLLHLTRFCPNQLSHLIKTLQSRHQNSGPHPKDLCPLSFLRQYSLHQPSAECLAGIPSNLYDRWCAATLEVFQDKFLSRLALKSRNPNRRTPPSLSQLRQYSLHQSSAEQQSLLH
ncbi:hypothetical protein ES703_61295 [subsurface metagenome]